MERLISIILALIILAFGIYWITTDEPQVEVVQEEEVVVEEEVVDAVKVEVEEEKKDETETATLKSLFKQEEVVAQDPLLVSLNSEFKELAVTAGQYVVGVVTERESKSETADNLEVKWQGLEDLPEKDYVSGTVLRSDGYIVTTYRAVAGAKSIRVSVARGLMKKATLVGVDPYTNLAVLKVETDPLVEVAWTDVNLLKRGELIMCVSSGNSFRKAFLSGVVSGKHRDSVLNDGISYEDFIQIDMPQVFGSDGAPVVNIKGEVVGIHSSVKVNQATQSGFAYAIPVDLVRFVTDSILEKGYVVRGGIGIRVQGITDNLATVFGLESVYGALISDVFEGGPGYEAGLLEGDIVTKIGDRKIDTAMRLRIQMAMVEPGQKVEMEILRDGEMMSIEVLVEERMPPSWVTSLSNEEIDSNKEREGADQNEDKKRLTDFKVEAFTSEIAEKYGYTSDKQGLVITEVETGSAAEQAGLQEGMEIMAINRRTVYSLEDWLSVISELNDEAKILLWIEWQGERKFYLYTSP